jgi:hypothetical protein
MSLGGRPKDGPGHRPFNMSLRKDIYNMLKKVPNKSDFVERTIRPVLEQLDPGPACEFIWEIDEKAKKLVFEAHRKKDYAKAMAIEAIICSLEDYRALCSKTIHDKKHCEDNGGRWENGVCIVEGRDTLEKYKINLPKISQK